MKPDPATEPRPVLDREQIARLHAASLEILERTGMRFYTPEALEVFARGGAGVSDGNMVRIPAALVERALATAPRDIVIFDRRGRPALRLDRPTPYFGSGSDCPHICDPYTGQRRKAVLQDVVNGVRLVDRLPELDFTMSMFLPSDVPVDTYERFQMQVMLEQTTKPIVFVGIAADSTAQAVELAAEAAGGLAELQRRPFVVNYINTTSALRHDHDNVARLLYAAERNLPTVYAPGNSRGTTAPMTVGGMLALGNAGQLAGLVLSQLKREGSPFILNNPACGRMDMLSLVDLYATPDHGASTAALAHHYGLPAMTSAGASNAKVFDAQAAAEAALTIFASAASGVNLNSNIGYLDSAMTGSLELVAFCNEVIGWVRRYQRPVDISDETLALDVIHATGPDGHFLEQDHTLKHVRDDWIPKLFERQDYDRWAAGGSTTLHQRANAVVRDILQTDGT